MEVREYADGTCLIVRMPFSFYTGGRALCSDGRVRALKRIAPTADTFFSVPAAVQVRGRTVSGFIMIETRSGSPVATEEDPAIVMFTAYRNGVNADLLPYARMRAGR